MAAKLPIKYTGAVVLGSNISGTFTAIISILSSTFTSSQRTAAIYYFITALLVLLICFDSYFALPLNVSCTFQPRIHNNWFVVCFLQRFYRHHEIKEKKEAQKRRRENQDRSVAIPYWTVFKQALPQLYNVFFVFFVTLSIFPAMHADIKPVDKDFVVPESYFASITCFLTFNVCAMLGSSLAGLVTWVSVFCRLVLIRFEIKNMTWYGLC